MFAAPGATTGFELAFVGVSSTMLKEFASCYNHDHAEFMASYGED